MFENLSFNFMGVLNLKMLENEMRIFVVTSQLFTQYS